MQVLPIPEEVQSDKNIPEGLHFGPMIVINGFEDIVFPEDVTIAVPYPAIAEHAGYERDTGQIHVMRYDGKEWKDVTDDVKCSKVESTINIQVKHFSM